MKKPLIKAIFSDYIYFLFLNHSFFDYNTFFVNQVPFENIDFFVNL